MEPTPADVAAVQATLPAAPEAPPATPPAAPAAPPTPPATPPVTPPATPEPAPVVPPQTPPEEPAAPAAPATPPTPPADPFASLFATEPAAPTQQPVVPPTAPPTEPATPPVVPPTAPATPAVEPTAPATPATPPAAPTYESYDDYMKRTLAGVPTPPEVPDPEKVNPEDPVAIKGFFDNLMTVAEQRIEAKVERKNAIQNAERRVWEEAFVAYPTLRTNKNVRDIVHNIRMGHFQRGQAITPTQAAQIFLDSLGNSYRQGVADNQVQTTIESVQPQGGGSQPTQTSLDRDSVLEAVQVGGEQALADILDKEVREGRL